MTKYSTSVAAIAAMNLTVESRNIGDLRPHPSNPRRHSANQVRKLVTSVKAHGFVVPVLIDHDGQILAGHARLLAAKEVGLSAVPTIRLDHLTDVQAKAFMIADNRLSELSTWDDQALGEILLDLSMQNLEFSLDVTGFDMGEIDFRIEGLDKPERKAARDKADELPSPADGSPVSRLGDLWLLDGHRVLCGSALEEASYTTLMGGEVAMMVFTDPPYNVPIQGHVSGLGRVRHREFAMASGEMNEGEFTTFLATACKLLAAHSADGSLHFLCMDWRHLPELLAAGGKTYTELKNICVWAKDNAGMGSLYRSQHEMVLVYKNGIAAHTNNVELGRHGRNRTNVWRYPGVNSFGRNGEEGNLLALHPTVKPVQLVADAILDCTLRGAIVVDAFLGSGTTVLAAERVGRRCFGLELDPIYVDTVIRRWQRSTGGVARHAISGQAFDEVARSLEAKPMTEPAALRLETIKPRDAASTTRQAKGNVSAKRKGG